jgi:hypothetical protein
MRFSHGTRMAFRADYGKVGDKGGNQELGNGRLQLSF